MMPGDGAVMKRSEKACKSSAILLKPDVSSVIGLEILVFDLALRFRRALLALRRIREAAHQIGEQLGKFLELLAAAALRHAGEAGHTLRHIGLKADAALLAVIADIDAGRNLLLHDMADRLVHLGGHEFGVVGLAFFLRDQKVAQGLVARQAADMGGENAIAAQDHALLRQRRFGGPVIAQFRDPLHMCIAAEFRRRHNALQYLCSGPIGGQTLRPRGNAAMSTASQSVSAIPSAMPSAMPRDYNFAADILKRNLDAGRAGKIAFIDHRGSFTYGELAERAERFGHVLRGLRIRREERMLMCLLDTIDWPTAFLGAIKAGVVAVPVNTLMTEDDYYFMLRDSRARLLVVSEELLPKFNKAIRESEDLEHVIVSGGTSPEKPRFEDLLTQASTKPVTAPTTRDDMCFWLYTSGSTGRPKGAVHTHADLRLTDDLYGGPFLGISENDICYSVAKLFFAYGLGNALTFPMSAGATTVLLARPADARPRRRSPEETSG